MLLLSCGGGNALEGVWINDDGVSIDFNDKNQIVTSNFFGDEANKGGSYTITDSKVTLNSSVTDEDEVYVFEAGAKTLKLKQDDQTVMELRKSERRSGYIKMFLGTLLGFSVHLFGNYALAIILFTILLKVVLLPLSINQTKSSLKMQKLAPIVKKINEKYKHDKQKAQQKTMELYQKAGANPLAGCLPLIINMVLLFAFFRVLLYPEAFLYYGGESLMVTNPEWLTGSFLWVSNLSQPDLLANLPVVGNWIPKSLADNIPGIMPILTAAVTYFSMNSMTVQQPGQDNNPTMKMFKYFMPVMFLFLGATYPAALMLYWTISSVFQMVQQPIIKKLVDKEAA